LRHPRNQIETGSGYKKLDGDVQSKKKETDYGKHPRGYLKKTKTKKAIALPTRGGREPEISIAKRRKDGEGIAPPSVGCSVDLNKTGRR